MSKNPICVAALAFLMLSTPALAFAGSATVEVIESGGKGQAVTHRFVVALADDGRPSKVESTSGRVQHKLSIQRTQPKRRTAVLHLDLHRRHHGGDSVSIAVTNRVPLGKRVVVGRVPRSKGGAVQVAVVLSR